MSLVEREDQDHVRVLWLNRPDKRNALSAKLVQALADELIAADLDSSVHVLVLAGRGKGFCSGGDLADGLSSDGGFLESHSSRGQYAKVLQQMNDIRPVVVAAVHGDALGGGFGLAVAADLLVVDKSSRLGTPEIHIGLFPMIITAVLQRNLPRKHLFELMMTGEKIDAQKAFELGFVNRIAADGDAVSTALELAQTIASRSSAVVALGKKAFYAVSDMNFDESLKYLHSQLTLNLLTEDAAEGVSAFIGRRKPEWKGR